jgi:hypothetical protein
MQNEIKSHSYSCDEHGRNIQDISDKQSKHLIMYVSINTLDLLFGKL